MRPARVNQISQERQLSAERCNPRMRSRSPRVGHRQAIVLAALFLAAFVVNADAGFPKFQEQVIDPNIGKVCYAVALADVDGDGRQDIVAVTENRVLWYQNPSWKKNVVIENQTVEDNVCIAPLDIDDDGQIDFAVGAGWPTKGGTIQWLSRAESLDKKWRVHMIGEEPWLHRMRFADVLGKGKPQLVISPLRSTDGDGVRLTAFEIPSNPATERWPRVVMDDSLNFMHNHWHIDFDQDNSIDTVTASQEGVYLVRRSSQKWTKTQLGTGVPVKQGQKSGAGEIKTGKLNNGERFIATIEPMHGTSVVVYTQPGATDRLWQRHVVDDTLNWGHAVWAADMDNDGSDELVIGQRNPGTGPVKGPGVFVYDVRDNKGTKWEKHVIDDGGIATEDAIVGDLTGDGRMDIVAGGRATHNLKLYINLGMPDK